MSARPLAVKKSALAPPLTLLLAIGLAAAWGAPPAQAAVAPPVVRSAAATTTTSALRLEPFGDSITYGSHSSTGNGYRGPLWNELTSEGHPLNFVGSVHEGTMADSDDEGHPGWRIDALQGLTGSISNYKPNVVTLLAGANDLIQNHDISTAPSRLSTLIDQVLANAAPGATVLVGNLSVSTNANIVTYGKAFNAALPAIVQSKQSAGKHVALVDFGAITTADLVSDGIHPNDGGYQKMADAWNNGVQTAASAGWIAAPVSLGAATAEGSGEVLSGIAGKCLDVKGGASTDGTAVQLWTCNHSGAQSWTVYTDGTLRSLGKCLDATAAGTANGTKAEIWSCNGSGAQLWQSYIGGGYINLASGRCLDDPGSSATDGTQLALWDCTGGANQQWAAAGLGPVISSNGNKCLDDFGGLNVNGTKAEIWDCHGGGAQQWVMRYSTLEVSSLCLDVVGAGTANGTLVDLWDCNGTANQTWQKGANGSLVNPVSGKCLDVPGYSTTNGTQLDIWDCNGGNNQRWTLAVS
jgi:lysophospholipase L1-like esterase